MEAIFMETGVAKSKTAYVCSDCGSEYAKWQGQCNDCKAWNTLSSLQIANGPVRGTLLGEAEPPKKLSDVSALESPRIVTGIAELDRVLGGGFVEGSVVLVSGNPGAGKSTLLIQVMCQLAGEYSALYVTGEESLTQVAMRAKRLKLPMEDLEVMSETSCERLIDTWNEKKPGIVVVDSIQVMYSAAVESSPGGVAQVRETAAQLIRQAKTTGTVLILVGHVTKDGSLAGPRVLEHMIDTFIMLEGDGDARYRTLRSGKNRFGAINELGVFAMTDKGLLEVSNPSAIFLSGSRERTPGSVVMVVWEGTRPLLVEAQALVDQSALGNPRRVAVGFEQNRLSMLLAILNRHGGIQAHDQDVFINAVGGIRVEETSSDLPVLLAVVSSIRNRPLPTNLIAFGEVGLSGEIRPVPNGQERLKEAVKHGFKIAVVPKANQPKGSISGLEVIPVSGLGEALSAVENR